MKRTAETQLTKDNADDIDEIEEVGTSKKVDSESLGARKIKALPKRPLSSSVAAIGPQPPSTKTDISGSSRFGVFSGFGTTPLNSDTDGKATQPSSLSLPPFTGFGAPTSTTFNAISSNTRKFYTFLTTSQLNFPDSRQESASSNVSTATTPSPSSVQKYYTDLRGLNVSFSKSIKESIDKDPFIDLLSMFESYQLLRENIQKDYDSSKAEPLSRKSTPLSSSGAQPSFTMPVPPAQFTFGNSTTVPATTIAPPSSGFTWPAPSSFSSSSSTEKPSSSSFIFGAPKPPSSGLFTFGSPAAKETPTPKTTTTPAADETADEKSSTSSSATVVQSFFKPTSAPMTPGFASFLTTPSSSSPKSPSTAFGSSLTSHSMTTGNNGNIGNPVGFSFGNVTPKFTTSTPSSPMTSAPSAPDDSLKAPAEQDTAEEHGDEGVLQANADKESKEEPYNPYDKDSVGEEDEETLFETKARAYLSVTNEENLKTWVSAGIGQLKLKRKRDGTRRRLLMRNSSNGKIIINTLAGPNFKLNVDGKHISFVVPNESGTAEFFKLRLSTETDAKEWEAKLSQQ